MGKRWEAVVLYLLGLSKRWEAVVLDLLRRLGYGNVGKQKINSERLK
jgi:hypothetical protein